MQKYYLKITTLSPVHIGTGEVYEPTNFVIDDGYLYEFDEVLFYRSLDEVLKRNFESRVENLFKIINFYRENRKRAKQIYFNKIKVTKDIENRYKKQFNKDGSLNKNQLNIDKTYKEPNSSLPVIPGSSLKGVFDTFLRIYSMPEVASNEIRQKLKISDALCIKDNVEVGIAKRVHKNPQKKAKNSIPINLEVIKEKSEFIFQIDTEFEMRDILRRLREFYENRKRLSSLFKISNDSFVMRVGKFCGKPFMVYSERNMRNRFGKDVATHTLYGDREFGWIEVKFLEEGEYKELFAQHNKLKVRKIQEIFERQKSIREHIESKERRKRELQKQEELEKQRRLEEEKKQKEADFQKAKTTDDIEFLENFVKKYDSEDISLYKQRLEELKKRQKESKLQALEQKAQKVFDEVMKKRGTKGFKKAKEKFIKKWSKEKENKGSQKILELVHRMEKLS